MSSLFKSPKPQPAPVINAAPASVFKGLTTPAFSLQPGTGGAGFSLARTAARPSFEGIFDQLGANQLGFTGLLPQIQGLGGQISAIRGDTTRLLDTSDLLRGQLGQTIPGLTALGGQSAGIGGRFAGLGGELAQVQAGIQPGFGRLTSALVQDVREREAAAAGNLRETLAQRNLSGSSFAIAEQQRQQRDFAQQEALVRGEAFQQELAATRDIAALRSSVLAGEAGTIDQQRAIIADTRATINNIGALLQLDSQTLSQQASLVGLQLGLTEAQSNIFANQLANIQVQLQATQQQIANDLNELGVAGNIVNQVTAASTQAAIAQAKLTADAAAAQGYLQATQTGQQASLFGGLIGTGIQAASLGGLFSAGATAAPTVGSAGLAALAFSDRRVKENIKRVGQLDSGLGVYTFKYIGDPMGVTYMGVMADEVELIDPSAVFEVDGIKAVNYGAL